MRFPRQRQEDTPVNLTPLIDVVFLLLIFFMVSTTFTRETRLDLVLPEAEGRPQVEAEHVEVVISASGHYSIDGEGLADNDAATLRSALLRRAAEGTDMPLMITADAEASHRYVVRVMDVAGALGFSNLNITTREPGE